MENDKILNWGGKIWKVVNIEEKKEKGKGEKKKIRENIWIKKMGRVKIIILIRDTRNLRNLQWN